MAQVDSADVLVVVGPSALAVDCILAALAHVVLEPETMPLALINMDHPTLSDVYTAISQHHIVVSRRRQDLTSFFPKQIQPMGDEGRQDGGDQAACDATMHESKAGEADKYKKKFTKAEKRGKALQADVERLEDELATANDRVASLQLEFEQFNQDVQELQSQYTKLLETNHRVLWDYLPTHDPAMTEIPPINHDIVETVTCVGDYTIHATIGEGQYASVYACSLRRETGHCPSLMTSPTVDALHGTPHLAVKAIDKSKLHDIVSLFRVHSEIAALRDVHLRHPSLLSVREVIHTSKFIYLVTERGGKDLFDFFGPHEHGVSEATALRIAFKIVEAVKHLHGHDYCHRDLKPENILFTQDNYMIKIVDFGLCAKVGTKVLTDFCGSPGFFAPEMLLHESYDGQKADVWSVGCILLELILGNTFFLQTWMTAYQLDVLSDRQHFHKLIQANIATTQQTLADAAIDAYSPKVKSLLVAMLCEDPRERPTIFQVAQHPWFEAHHRRNSARHKERHDEGSTTVKATMSMIDMGKVKRESHAALTPTRPISAGGDKLTLPSIKSNSPEKATQPLPR
ncbi:Aste57867_23102 [Aphanomyces stellatus]|uniref:Aste57867_23102 protein n=1 Tax=Aphanomyces stellatus TaxID=120398 RepID=A0A485LLZ7_9STRA|nr:hypothetical protein As57867_023031 [Aphanomyces stellatus]VFT99750.1 Aste57867_23102 [Aphanomyces stellatus]